MSNLAIPYASLGKYTDVENLQIQVLDMRNRPLEQEHPDKMYSLTKTYQGLGKYADAEKLQIKPQYLWNRLLEKNSQIQLQP